MCKGGLGPGCHAHGNAGHGPNHRHAGFPQRYHDHRRSVSLTTAAPVRRRNQTKRYAIEAVLADTQAKSIDVSTLAKNINNCFWYRRKVSGGTKGPIVSEFARRQIILSNSGPPQRTLWLLIRRTVGSSLEYSFFISNAPASVTGDVAPVKGMDISSAGIPVLAASMRF